MKLDREIVWVAPSAPRCWECDEPMEPRLRADWRPWWYCGRCNRLTPVRNLADYLALWMPQVRIDGGVQVHRFESEGQKAPGGPLGQEGRHALAVAVGTMRRAAAGVTLSSGEQRDLLNAASEVEGVLRAMENGTGTW